MKKRNLFAALTFAGALLSASASASIIYSVDRTVGSGSVSGTITTDGSLGVLTTESVIDWSLTLTDKAGSYLLNYGNSDFFGVALSPFSEGVGLTASRRNLLFDPVDDGGFMWLQFLEIGGGGPIWYINGDTYEEVYAGPSQYDLSGIEEHQAVFNSRYVSGPGSGGNVIGISVFDVNEPASVFLVSLALAGLIGARAMRP